MNFCNRLFVLATVFAFPPAAICEEATTVQSLLKQQFTVISAVASPIGPGLFLAKGDRLFLCFVTETSESSTIETRYCKPVR